LSSQIRECGAAIAATPHVTPTRQSKHDLKVTKNPFNIQDKETQSLEAVSKRDKEKGNDNFSSQLRFELEIVQTTKNSKLLFV